MMILKLLRKRRVGINMEVFLTLAVLIFYILAFLGYIGLLFILIEVYDLSMPIYIVTVIITAIAYWTLISTIASWVFTPLT